MIISVEDTLSDIYDGLKKMGHEVYKFSDNVVSDVVVYSGSKNSLSYINSSNITNNDSAVFLIDGDNKSYSEIAEMIKNRVYSSLF